MDESSASSFSTPDCVKGSASREYGSYEQTELIHRSKPRMPTESMDESSVSSFSTPDCIKSSASREYGSYEHTELIHHSKPRMPTESMDESSVSFFSTPDCIKGSASREYYQSKQTRASFSCGKCDEDSQSQGIDSVDSCETICPTKPSDDSSTSGLGPVPLSPVYTAIDTLNEDLEDVKKLVSCRNVKRNRSNDRDIDGSRHKLGVTKKRKTSCAQCRKRSSERNTSYWIDLSQAGSEKLSVFVQTEREL